jgi:hypothetical protein
MSTVQWLVRSPSYPNAVIPVKDERAAQALIVRYREVAKHHRARVSWEYGVHQPGKPNSYRRVSR